MININFHYIIPLILLIVMTITGCSNPDPATLELGVFDYKKQLSTVTCQANMRNGKSGKSDSILFQNNIHYHLRTPENYDSKKGHPLLMVYAPAGRNGKATEKFVHLTHSATESGFIIAYVDSQRMALKTIVELGDIPAHIAKTWCIDQDNVFFTGHSDGGTISTALAFLEETRSLAKAIVPSAAGMRAADFKEVECPEPISVMVMHNDKDRAFPGFGAEAAQWWSKCNQCDSTLKPSNIEGCKEYSHCAEKIRTLYCEAQGSHSRWPAMNNSIIKFLESNI